jgi:hypothetical protein
MVASEKKRRRSICHPPAAPAADSPQTGDGGIVGEDACWQRCRLHFLRRPFPPSSSSMPPTPMAAWARHAGLCSRAVAISMNALGYREVLGRYCRGQQRSRGFLAPVPGLTRVAWPGRHTAGDLGCSPGPDDRDSQPCWLTYRNRTLRFTDSAQASQALGLQLLMHPDD